MDAIEQLKEEVRTGRIDANRLVDLLGALQQQLQAARQRNTELLFFILPVCYHGYCL